MVSSREIRIGSDRGRRAISHNRFDDRAGRQQVVEFILSISVPCAIDEHLEKEVVKELCEAYI